MYQINRLQTDESWPWFRCEHLVLLLVWSTILAPHTHQIAWGRFCAAFVLIDLIGFVPGAIAFRRAGNGPIRPIYHHLYNLTHSYLTAIAVAILWASISDGFEWAMLALPIHLSGDRGVLGNSYKPVSQPFEHLRTQIALPKPAMREQGANR
jgi:hypothetical protein